jgi:PAS domain S-box-containing protein
LLRFVRTSFTSWSFRKLLNHFYSLISNLNLLTSIVYKKTGGNPFYIKTFIYALIDEKELTFSKGEWKYSLETVQSYSASINIVDIINKKFKKLPKNQQSFLQHLSILGNRFELETSLKMLNDFGYTQEQMQDAQDKGFIDQSLGQYQFAHDQIQDYVFNSIEEEDKRRIHLKVGRFLEKAYKDRSFSDIISAVDHLNSAYKKGNFSKRLFKLNILALEEMLKKNDYPRAMEKVLWIKENLYDDSLWEKDHNNAFKFRFLSSKTLYLNAVHQSAYKEINSLIKELDNVNERIKCFTLFKDICVTQGKYFNELVDLGSSLFNSLGLYFPSGKKDLAQSVLKLQEKVSNNPLFKHPPDILKLKKAKNFKAETIISLLEHYWEVAYYLADLDMMQWAYLNIIETSFKYGNTKESCFGYVLYGAQLTSQREYKKASEFGTIALRLNHIFDNKEMLPKIHNFVANFINSYTKPFASNTVLYQKSLHQSKLNGDIVFGTWANFLMHFSDFLSGTSLEVLQQKLNDESDFILHSGDAKMISIFKVLVHTIERLHDDNEYSYIEDDKNAILLWKQENFYPALSWYGIIKAQSSFLYGNFEEGLNYLQTYVRNEENEVIMFPKIRLHFLRALLLLGKEDSITPEQEMILKADLAKFYSFAKASPKNFKFKKLLLSAESMKHTESVWDVAKMYDKCLVESRQLKNNFYTSLVGLCAGRFFQNLHFNDLASTYFNEAIAGLKQWGAFRPAKELKLFSENREKLLLNDSSQYSLSHSSSSNTEVSNLQSLLTSLNAISKAQNNKELIQTLMKIILQNATASKAILIFQDDNAFKIKARVDFEKESGDLLDLDYSATTIVPVHLISYVINTSQRLNLHNPSESGKFQLDPYIKSNRPASCLVIPALIEGSVKAILYLENKDLVTPLAHENIKTIEHLLTQAAIVFKNTSLYETLKSSEDNLTKAQEISNVGSWKFNSKDEKIVWSAQTYRIYELDPFSINIDYQWFSSHLHPDDADYVSKSVEKALKGERYYNVIHRIVTAKGNVRKVNQRAEAYYEGNIQKMSGTIQDITQYEEAKEEISRLSQVVYQGPYSTIITDIRGNIEYINEQTLKMTGYSKEEILGQNMNIFRSGIHTDDFYDGLWKTIKDEKSIWKGTFFNKMKNDDILDCHSSIFPVLNENNEILNFVTIQEDTTAQNIKDKLFLMQTRQAQMGEMLSMIAHQWRQPLSIITALTNSQRVNIMLEKSTTDGLLQNYTEIEEQVAYLSNTITDFRDFFKPDKKVTLTKSSTIITKVLKLIKHALRQASIKVQTHYLNDPEYKTFEHEMEQVILNIVKNSQDVFLDRKIEKPLIDITCDEINGDAVIIIEDNAKGIDKEVIDTLFLPYVSTKDQKHGTGLGLYMSKTIVEEHCGGELMVENTAQGARFSIKIPLKDLHA